MRSVQFIAGFAFFAGLIVTFSLKDQALPEEPADKTALEHCRAIPEATVRLRCYEELTPERTQQPYSNTPQNTSAWRLVRAPRQDGGNDFVSMMRTADTLHSDPDFAG